ncbi:amidohydrolase family protein [Actinomadura oligospora]|uniref:amidohydrolase family protein n=1 Tax=Actinomadura oligospora TaxID=111804 RepID=UPI00047C79CB|nr:amidohydrolase family protein [Actinomadura oligospora]
MLDDDIPPLVDHHCHGVVRRDLDRAGFEALMTEADAAPGPLGGSFFDARVGMAVRRWCAPVLDLAPHASPDAYLARRAELGFAEVNRRFLASAGVDALCVDTGFDADGLLTPDELGGLAGATAHEIVRLETLAETVAARDDGADGFPGAFRAALADRTRNAIGVKSIAAYRAGLDLAGERPTDREVGKAVERLLRGASEGGTLRVADPVLHRFLVWCASDLRLPVQFHVGYGDAEADLRLGDPLLLTGLLRELARAGTPVLLLHNYPFHRNAGYLTQVFPNVFADVGLALHGVGDRASVLLGELLELAPFGKVLYSSDAYGLAEYYHLAALLFRRALAMVLDGGVAQGSWTGADASRLAGMIAAGNARRVYGLDRE